MGFDKIRDSIRLMAGLDEPKLIYCTVESVEGILCECKPIDENEANIFDVRLVCEESDANFYLMPKVGSQVLVALVDDNSGYIAVFGEIESVAIRGDQ
jgi:hypothetical protein